MKKLATMLTLALVILTLASTAMAGGPWEVKVEGNGVVSGGALSSYNVVEADIGWNFKLNEAGEINGHLNIVEKLDGGTTRQFQLSGYEVDAVGDPAVRPILFNCAAGGGDARSVRVEGVDVETGYTVAVHFRDSEHTQDPNTVWYWVKDGDGNFITNTAARLPVSNPFTLVCE